MVIEALHHDVGALDEAHFGVGVAHQPGIQHIADPGAGGIDEAFGVDGVALACAGVFHLRLPQAVVAFGIDKAGAGADDCTAVGSIPGVQDDEARIIDTAIGIFESPREKPRLQRAPDLVLGKIEGAGRRQMFAPAQMVVKEQAEAQEPSGSKAFGVGQDEAERANDMGCKVPQPFALAERFAHQPKLVIFDITQPAMNELGRPR